MKKGKIAVFLVVLIIGIVGAVILYSGTSSPSSAQTITGAETLNLANENPGQKCFRRDQGSEILCKRQCIPNLGPGEILIAVPKPQISTGESCFQTCDGIVGGIHVFCESRLNQLFGPAPDCGTGTLQVTNKCENIVCNTEIPCPTPTATAVPPGETPTPTPTETSPGDGTPTPTATPGSPGPTLTSTPPSVTGTPTVAPTATPACFPRGSYCQYEGQCCGTCIISQNLCVGK